MNPATEPENITISKSKGVRIDWKDGHHSEYSLAWLRDHCPCASCTGVHGTQPDKISYSAPSPNPFPIYKPALRILEVMPAGRYALQIKWSDGHQSGIYSWEHLRAICPCDECASRRSIGNED